MQSNAVTALPLSALPPRHPRHLLEKEGRNIAKSTLSLPTKFSQVLLELANPVRKESPQKKAEDQIFPSPPPFSLFAGREERLSGRGGESCDPCQKVFPS